MQFFKVQFQVIDLYGAEMSICCCWPTLLVGGLIFVGFTNRKVVPLCQSKVFIMCEPGETNQEQRKRGGCEKYSPGLTAQFVINTVIVLVLVDKVCTQKQKQRADHVGKIAL